MIKKDITFTDFSGIVRTETHHFHLSKVEIAELEYSAEGGLSTMLQKMVSRGDVTKIIPLFQTLVKKSYGVRSADMKRFKKSEDALGDFIASGAYDEFVFELLQSPEKADAFVRGLLPADVQIVDDNKPVES